MEESRAEISYVFCRFLVYHCLSDHVDQAIRVQGRGTTKLSSRWRARHGLPAYVNWQGLINATRFSDLRISLYLQLIVMPGKSIINGISIGNKGKVSHR